MAFYVAPEFSGMAMACIKIAFFLNIKVLGMSTSIIVCKQARNYTLTMLMYVWQIWLLILVLFHTQVHLVQV